MIQFSEHDNRKKAKNLAEFITGDALRRYMADKVRQYAGEQVSVFDGAAGSGQLCQYIQPTEFVAVEIQPEACKELAKNFPHAKICNQSFFTDLDTELDCAVMNPPFSIKFKDLSDAEQANIQALFPWKKSGVVDDVFVLKAMQYSKRWGFFILFPGVGYRNTEKKFRELLTPHLVELSTIENAFDDTPIGVIFIVLDKLKNGGECYGELYDCKTKQVIHSHTITPDADRWETPQKPTPEPERIDPVAHEYQARQATKNMLIGQLRFSKVTAMFEPETASSFNAFCDELIQAINAEKVDDLFWFENAI